LEKIHVEKTTINAKVHPPKFAASGFRRELIKFTQLAAPHAYNLILSTSLRKKRYLV